CGLVKCAVVDAPTAVLDSPVCGAVGEVTLKQDSAVGPGHLDVLELGVGGPGAQTDGSDGKPRFRRHILGLYLQREDLVAAVIGEEAQGVIGRRAEAAERVEADSIGAMMLGTEIDVDK